MNQVNNMMEKQPADKRTTMTHKTYCGMAMCAHGCDAASPLQSDGGGIGCQTDDAPGEAVFKDQIAGGFVFMNFRRVGGGIHQPVGGRVKRLIWCIFTRLGSESAN